MGPGFVDRSWGLRDDEHPKLFLNHTRLDGVSRDGHDLGMTFLKQRFHEDPHASSDPGMTWAV